MTAVLRLLWTFIVRPLRRDLIRTALTVVSVALGVAVVIAIELAGEAAAGSFRSSLETLLGKTDLQITANGGVDEIWVARLAVLPRNLRVAPVIEVPAVIEGVGSVPLYGVDLLARQPDGLTISTALARRLRIQAAGSKLALQINDVRQEYRVANILDAKDAEFALLDIADAQQAAGSYGKLDRIDIYVSPREDFPRLESDLRAMLPASYSLDKPGVRGQENQRMLQAFRWNLRALSYISLLVGAFLIYNTISVSVVRRRPEIGILRALGAGRLAVLSLFLGEALLLGLAGSLAGVLLGRILAQAAVGLIADTVNSLYASSRPAQVELTLSAVIAGVVAGAIVALVSALAPAREAMAVTPVSAMGRGAHERQARLRWGRRLIWAALLGRCGAARFPSALSRWQAAVGLRRGAAGGRLRGIRRAGSRATGHQPDPQCDAPPVWSRRNARRTRPGRIAFAHRRDRRRARYRDCHDGQRRHHGGKLSRDRARLARSATSRRPLRAPLQDAPAQASSPPCFQKPPSWWPP